MFSVVVFFSLRTLLGIFVFCLKSMTSSCESSRANSESRLVITDGVGLFYDNMNGSLGPD